MNSFPTLTVLIGGQLVILAVVLVTLHKVRRIHLATFPLLAAMDATRRESHSIFPQIQALLSLERRLALPDALPAMRGWAGSPDFLLFVADTARERKPRTVLECSSGVSTVVLARCMQKNDSGHVFSLEHSPEYAERTRQMLEFHGLAAWATVIDAPLTGAQPWYSLENLPTDIGPIELLVVDGPPAASAPLARQSALPRLLDRLADHAAIILDDAARPDEQQIIRQWLESYPSLTASTIPAEKGCVLIEHRAHSAGIACATREANSSEAYSNANHH